METKNKLFFFISIILCLYLYSSCTHAIVPRQLKNHLKDFNYFENSTDTNQIEIKKGYYKSTIRVYLSKTEDSVLKYSNEGILIKEKLFNKENFYNLNSEIIFYESGMCLILDNTEHLLSYLQSEISRPKNIGEEWGRFKIINDNIIVKTISRGSLNAGTYGYERRYKIKGKKKIELFYLNKLNNSENEKYLTASNIDSIVYFATELYPLKNNLIHLNQSWLINKKWFWKNKADYKTWKKYNVNK
jgi:hypothetical protein